MGAVEVEVEERARTGRAPQDLHDLLARHRDRHRLLLARIEHPGDQTLLAQAAVELQIAAELLQIAADEEAGPSGVTRAAETNLQAAIADLEEIMATPVSAGLAGLSSIQTRAAAAQR